MIDTRIFFFEMDPSNFNQARFWSPVAFHDEAFIEQNGEGWEPVDHNYVFREDGQVIVSLLMKKEYITEDAPE